ncbi:unnamed protein product [Thlaspi arvense]|uniref:Uncharacterized protein n=1 Tax=Thlaspi arvense TaxID=13288 RepID=A0AAU9SG31_THLAR|nr:unnamed protein product [Thlaspi arvense]
MPLCYSKVEQITAEDLVELSEIEKHNLGQIHRQGSMLDVDNSPQSLLAFSGHDNIHGLYDFLLNYRFNITSLSGVDVPVLYSPVPFQNAALSSPEVKCKAMKTADNICYPVKDVNAQDVPNQSSLAGFGYGIEIKDAYLPPWVVCSVCEALDSEGISFEARASCRSWGLVQTGLRNKETWNYPSTMWPSRPCFYLFNCTLGSKMHGYGKLLSSVDVIDSVRLLCCGK